MLEKRTDKVGGVDNCGNKYASLEDLWKQELNDNNMIVGPDGTFFGGKEVWYKDSVNFYDNQPATLNGVLGGYA